MKPAAVYLRISRDAEGEALGVARQREDCLALAQAAKLDVVEVFTDNDIGASKYSKKLRPEYERMLADAKAGRFSTIVAYTTSRLTRRPVVRQRKDGEEEVLYMWDGADLDAVVLADAA